MLEGDDGAVDLGDPLGDLLDIRDRRREGDERDVLGTVDDDLFPHGATSLITHVVALIEDRIGQIFRRSQVKHIAEDLRGHYQNRRLGVHLHVAGQDANLLRAKLAAEICILLVAERLNGGRVGNALLMREGSDDGKLGDERLAGTGRRGDNHRHASGDVVDGLFLKGIEDERITPAEGLEQGQFGWT
jgi:hypothetical protein